jgi:subtilisin-like proprotein convertase family protein
MIFFDKVKPTFIMQNSIYKYTWVIACICLLFVNTAAYAQETFPGTTGLIPTVGTSGPADFTANVSIDQCAAVIGINVEIQQVEIDLNHTWISDLEIDLVAPDGVTRINLFDECGGNGDNLLAIFQDGNTAICSSGDIPPFGGTYSADGGQLNTVFAGQDANGTWTLAINDQAGGDSGEMNAWSMTFVCLSACEITCPGPVVQATTGTNFTCSAMVEIPQPTLSDECEPATLTNDYNGTADASDEYPSGTTTVTFTAQDEEGLPASCSFEVVVEDTTPPEFINCSDVIVNLDPGDCSVPFNFIPSAVDNCALFSSASFSAHQNGGFGPDEFLSHAIGVAGGGVVCGFINEAVSYARVFDPQSFGIPNYTQSIEIQSVDFVLNFNSPANPVTVNIYSIPAGTLPPTMATAILEGTSTMVHPVSFDNYMVNQPVSATISPYDWIVMELSAVSNAFGGTIFSSDGGPFGGAPELAPSYAAGCPSLGIFPDWTDVDSFFVGFSLLAQLNFEIIFPGVVPSPDNPFALGEQLPIGSHHLSFIATDESFNSSTCELTLTVVEFDDPVPPACNDQVNVSVDSDCEALINADMILEGGPYGCYDHYFIEVEGVGSGYGSVSVVGHVGEWLTVTVTDPDTGIPCWGTIHLEDKIPPVIECNCPPDGSSDDPNCAINCLDAEALIAGNIPADLYPVVTDNCETTTTVTSVDFNGADCEEGVILVTFTAADSGGNSVSCESEFTIKPFTLDEVECPAYHVGECGDSIDPANTGYPSVGGISLGSGIVCNIFTTYDDSDPIAGECGGAYKIVRTWTLLDWCAQTASTCSQVIKLEDNTAPHISYCPGDFTIGTEFWYCWGETNLPKPSGYDDCSDPLTWEVMGIQQYVVMTLQLKTR